MSRGQYKEQILEAGLTLLYQQGFNASGIQEITNASNVPKGSFYNYFKSKEDFAEQVIELYTEEMSTYLERLLLQANGSPLYRLRALFDMWIAQYKNGNSCGCLSGNLSQELAIQSPKLQKALDRSFNQLQAYFITCLVEAKEAGEINKNLDSKLLGAFIYNSWQGAMVRIKAQGSSEALEQFQEVVFENLLR